MGGSQGLTALGLLALRAQPAFVPFANFSCNRLPYPLIHDRRAAWICICMCICMCWGCRMKWPLFLDGYKTSTHLPCMHVCVLSCLVVSTLCDPTDCSPPGSSVHGIFQARMLEWVAISSSRGPSQPRDRTHVSCIPHIGRQILYHWVSWEASYTSLGDF